MMKLAKMFLLDTIKINILMNYYLFKNFLDNITNEYIKNNKDTLEEFKTVKNKR